MVLGDTDTGDSRVLKVVAVVVAVAVAAGLVVAFVWRGNDSPPTASGTAGSSTPRPAPKPLPQAKWRIRAFPSAVTKHVTKKDLKVARKQGRRATQAIENVYNALLLDPPSADRVIRAHFEAASAQAFLRARPRISSRITRIRTTDRRIRIGVDAGSSQRAVATVSVSFKGKRGSERVKVKHRATLWLERVHHSWKVVAWRARRGPG
jgi:hypothetical protein